MRMLIVFFIERVATMRRIMKYILLTVILGLMSISTGRRIEASELHDALRLWVITDVHHLSPTLYDDGERIQDIQNSGAGLDIFYSSQRLEALTYQIEKATPRPDALIVSGDLTLNGEYQSLNELKEIFTKIEELGVKVFVIPGNHDVYNGWARSFRGNKAVEEKQITPQDFEVLMAEFGYQEAYLRDEASLSYVAKVNTSHWLIMLDTNIYSEENRYQPPISGGRLNEVTLKWLDEALMRSQEEGADVTLVLHHNAIPHFDGFGRQFAIENSQDLVNILEKYRIKVTLSGHIHAQHIVHYNGSSDDSELVDIATGAFSVQPSVIGEITYLDDEGSYQQKQLAVEEWAEQTGQEEWQVLNYSAYIAKVFSDANQRLDQRQSISSSATMLVNELNLAFFAGNIAEVWNAFDLQNKHAVEELVEDKKGFINQYIQLLMKQRFQDHLYYEWKY